MVRKIFRTGNSLVISLPRESIEMLGLKEGSEVSVAVDEEHGRIIIEPAIPIQTEIDREYAKHLADFIEQYRPALEALVR